VLIGFQKDKLLQLPFSTRGSYNVHSEMEGTEAVHCFSYKIALFHTPTQQQREGDWRQRQYNPTTKEIASAKMA